MVDYEPSPSREDIDNIVIYLFYHGLFQMGVSPQDDTF
jgi:hypothetical protein